MRRDISSSRLSAGWSTVTGTWWCTAISNPNLLLDAKSNVKIADFGLSNVMRDGHFLKTSCGSPNYAAPEVISGKLYSGPEVDVWSCGVILYALLCGSLPFDDESIPNLFKKIKGGIYNLPSHLSPGARDLIARMLLVDPLKRITISEIRTHPWFVVHLPRYLVVPPPDTLAQATNVDAETLEMVVNLGFEREHVVDALRHQLRNKATVAYFLLLDNRRNLFGGYLGAEFEAGELQQGAEAAGQLAGAGGKGAVGPRRPSQVQAHLMQQRLVAEQRWMLGSTTQMAPAEVMAEIFRVLRAMNVSWKKLGPYNLKCLYKIGGGGCGGGWRRGEDGRGRGRRRREHGHRERRERRYETHGRDGSRHVREWRVAEEFAGGERRQGGAGEV